MLLNTPHGEVKFPAFLPVTTFGDEYPLDRLVQPFLYRVSDVWMVSYHYARQMAKRPQAPLFIDSGGFGLLMPGSRLVETEGMGCIETAPGEMISPPDVLALQLDKAADILCPLDFPIPPSLDDEGERSRRQRLTLANARWLLDQPLPHSVTVVGCVQGYDHDSYLAMARALLGLGYRHLAIGGLVPRLPDIELVKAIVAGVRSIQPADALLHVFGAGKPQIVAAVIAAGATSTDSSSYLKAAADGVAWDGSIVPDDLSPLERAHLAVRNGAECAQRVRAAQTQA